MGKAVSEWDREGFEDFWQEYPRKQAKKDAFKAWCQVQPTRDTQVDILAALNWQKHQRNWRENMLYIPMPASYLRGERWTDEPLVLKDRDRKPWCEHVPMCRAEQVHRKKLAVERGEAG